MNKITFKADSCGIEVLGPKHCIIKLGFEYGDDNITYDTKNQELKLNKSHMKLDDYYLESIYKEIIDTMSVFLTLGS